MTTKGSARSPSGSPPSPAKCRSSTKSRASPRWRRTDVIRRRAFSLLEVMVAIALLSMGMVLLLQVQARSISLAQQSRTMTMGTQLLRSKLLDCQADLMKKGFSVGDYNE